MKKRFFVLAAALLSSFSPVWIFADPDISYREEVDKRIIQHIEWKKDGAALDYLVEIEREKGEGAWSESVRQITKENFIDVSLPSGTYRYKVTPGDLLGRRTALSDWAKLTVLPLFRPALESFSPIEFFLNEVEKDFSGLPLPFVIDLTGENLREDSKIFLRTKSGKTITPSGYGPASNGKSAWISFEAAELSDGLYDVVAENPGGLSATLRNFRIAQSREGGGFSGPLNAPWRFYMSEGYSPAIAFPSLFNDFFKRNFFELGVLVRFGWTPFKLFRGPLGLELRSGYHFFSTGLNDPAFSTYDISAHLVNVMASLTWGMPLGERFRLNFRAGGGVSVLIDVQLMEDRLFSPPRGGWIPTAGGGLSMSFFIFHNFYLDAGADIIYLFSVDDPPPAYLIPFFTVGFKF